ncbi:MAG: tetraacyldisaccharide 4'-kinase [Acidobacteria bacterium]|nr:tetraacyldisaccharide 4'-kinase [Acidobacteriota bacterium]
MAQLLPLSGLASGTAALWIAGARLRTAFYGAGLFRRRRLQARVISVGNLAWGGAGKTPFTIWLAERLQRSGLSVSILTRGYGRASRERIKVLPPGITWEQTRQDGDEVQIYVRHLRLPIGISRSRFEAGTVLERTFSVDTHLLDDGFQHLTLERDLDMVLVDASNPWGARRGWPVLLREGFSSLRRAHAIVLTRCELVERARIEKLQQTMRSYNPDARCFLASTKLTQFAAWPGNTPISIENMAARRPLAFCGLGNPQNFLGTLSRAQVNPAAKFSFADHRKYIDKDVATLCKLAKKKHADCIVTTEKDIVNLPIAAAIELPLYWAMIESVVEDEDELISWILKKLQITGSNDGQIKASTARSK